MDNCTFCPWILPALAVGAALGIGVWFWRSRKERVVQIRCDEWCPLSESEYCPEDKTGCPLKQCNPIQRHGKEDDTRRTGG